MEHQHGGVILPKRRSSASRHPHFLRDVRVARSLSRTTEEFYDLSEDEQALQLEEWELAARTCSHCGNPLEKCSDPESVWYPQLITCKATMEKSRAERQWHELHPDDGAVWHDGTRTRWASERTASTPYHRDDGAYVTVTDVDYGLGGDFLKAPMLG